MKNGIPNPGAWNLATWSRIAAFEVLGDYAPMSGFRVLVAVGPTQVSLTEALEHRANDVEPLDPELARAVIRAGLGVLRDTQVEFAYATAEHVLAVLRPNAATVAGALVAAEARVVSAFAARLSLLCGREMPLQARIFEVPDVTVVRRAVVSLAEDVEEHTPLRTAVWLGSQLRGRGQAFHSSMVETLEEQTSLLRGHGIDMDTLPPWWWRGVAASVEADGTLRVFDDLPNGEALGELVPE